MIKFELGRTHDTKETPINNVDYTQYNVKTLANGVSQEIKKFKCKECGSRDIDLDSELCNRCGGKKLLLLPHTTGDLILLLGDRPDYNRASEAEEVIQIRDEDGNIDELVLGEEGSVVLKQDYSNMVQVPGEQYKFNLDGKSFEGHISRYKDQKDNILVLTSIPFEIIMGHLSSLDEINFKMSKDALAADLYISKKDEYKTRKLTIYNGGEDNVHLFFEDETASPEDLTSALLSILPINTELFKIEEKNDDEKQEETVTIDEVVGNEEKSETKGLSFKLGGN